MTITAAPPACPICGAAKSHDAPTVGTLQGRIYNCGAIVCTLDEGEWEVTLYCEKTGDVLAELRAEVARLIAENRRLGDQNVLMAMELEAIAETAEASLAASQITRKSMQTVLDLAVEALAGNAPASVAPNEPAKAGSDLSVTAASALPVQVSS